MLLQPMSCSPVANWGEGGEEQFFSGLMTCLWLFNCFIRPFLLVQYSATYFLHVCTHKKTNAVLLLHIFDVVKPFGRQLF